MNSSVLILIGRILLSIDFIYAGFGKLTNAAGTGQYFASLGLPAPEIMPYLVGGLELFGGLAVLVGFQTRIAALALAAFCIGAAFIGHAGDVTNILKNFALAGGFVVLAGAGSGAYGVDRAPRERRY